MGNKLRKDLNDSYQGKRLHDRRKRAKGKVKEMFPDRISSHNNHVSIPRKAGTYVTKFSLFFFSLKYCALFVFCDLCFTHLDSPPQSDLIQSGHRI